MKITFESEEVIDFLTQYKDKVKLIGLGKALNEEGYSEDHIKRLNELERFIGFLIKKIKNKELKAKRTN
jgi:hypothetical protein